MDTQLEADRKLIGVSGHSLGVFPRLFREEVNRPRAGGYAFAPQGAEFPLPAPFDAMKLHIVSTFLLPALLLASCGGGEVNFSSVGEAMQAAERARGTGAEESATAISAYEYVLANSESPAEQRTALLGLYDVQLESGEEMGAVATYERLQKEHGEFMTLEKSIELIDKAIRAQAVDAADLTLNAALAVYSDQGEAFAIQVEAVDRFKTEGADADLSGLGYTGD